MSDYQSKALRASINVNAKLKFSSSIDVENGSFYLMAIETEEVILVSSFCESLPKNLESSDKPKILGEFWEENTSYSFDDLGSNVFSALVDGSFAFELSDKDSLDGYDVDSGDINYIAIAWAESGDDPKIIAATLEFSGGLEDCEEDDEFSGFD